MNHRLALCELMKGVIPFDPLEEEHISNVLAWIHSGEEIYRITKPATPYKHLVVYFVLVDENRSKMLLVDHRRAELWLPAGGHVEPSELPEVAVRRELKEELDVTADFIFEGPFFVTVTLSSTNTTPHIDVSLWYVLRGDSTVPLNFDKREATRVEWFDASTVPYKRADPHMKRFVDKLIFANVIK